MRKLRYSLADVFTRRAFGGNQLAVFTDARDLSQELMQALAREITSEQGFEMGRPSFIRVEIEQEEKQITGVRVGGQCYFMGEGTIELP